MRVILKYFNRPVTQLLGDKDLSLLGDVLPVNTVEGGWMQKKSSILFQIPICLPLCLFFSIFHALCLSGQPTSFLCNSRILGKKREKFSSELNVIIAVQNEPLIQLTMANQSL